MPKPIIDVVIQMSPQLFEKFSNLKKSLGLTYAQLVERLLDAYEKKEGE